VVRLWTGRSRVVKSGKRESLCLVGNSSGRKLDLYLDHSYVWSFPLWDYLRGRRTLTVWSGWRGVKLCKQLMGTGSGSGWGSATGPERVDWSSVTGPHLRNKAKMKISRSKNPSKPIKQRTCSLRPSNVKNNRFIMRLVQ